LLPSHAAPSPALAVAHGQRLGHFLPQDDIFCCARGRDGPADAHTRGHADLKGKCSFLNSLIHTK